MAFDKVIKFIQSSVGLVNFKVVSRKSKQNEIFLCKPLDYSISLKNSLKLPFTTLLDVTISKNCSDHFCEIDHFSKMTLLVLLKDIHIHMYMYISNIYDLQFSKHPMHGNYLGMAIYPK